MRNNKYERNFSCELLITMLAVLLLFSACSSTTTRSHPEFAAAKREIRTIALTPVDTEFVTMNFTGENERNFEAEAAFNIQLLREAEALLGQSGYRVQRLLLEKIVQGDKQLAFELEQTKASYARVSQALYKNDVSEEEAKKFKMAVGPSVNLLAAAAEADALLLMRYRGYARSGGMVAKDVVVSSLLAVLTGFILLPAADSHAIEVALIDGVTGDVLWTNLTRTSGISVAEALKPLPQAATVAAVPHEKKEGANQKPHSAPLSTQQRTNY